MNEKIKILLAKKEARKTELAKEAEACTEVEKLTRINTELDVLNEEIDALNELNIEPAQAPVIRTAAVNGSIPSVVTAGAQTKRQTEPDDMEYRKAFAQFVTRGTPIPPELRADQNTTTTDIATAIPSIVVDRIIEKMESFGMILPLVTRTSYTSGVNIPTSTVKPVATWASEGSSSDRQKKTSGYISFSKFKLRCEISMSMEVATMAISAFETNFARQVSEAMVQTIEGAILSTADGTTSPKGILAEIPATGQALTAATVDYDLLVRAEAALPQAYENGAVWCMTKKTFMSFVGMVDTNKQPIARVTYGISGTPDRTLLGRSVVLCGDYMDSFSTTLTVGKIFAFLFRFKDYVLNTVYDMGIQRKQDWDTEDFLTKAVMSVDGKAVDTKSMVTIVKSA